MKGKSFNFYSSSSMWSSFLHLLLMCVCVCIWIYGHCLGVEVGGKFMGVLFLHCVDPGDQTWAVRIGSTHSLPLSHLTGIRFMV